MFRLTSVLVLCAAVMTTACGDDTQPATGPTQPTAITESFAGTLTVNGGQTHQFAVQQTGTITATLTSLSVDGATVGFLLGTWNGQTCAFSSTGPSAGNANDNAVQGNTITATAGSTGNFCARIYDVGKLTRAVDYQITVSHF